MNRLSLILTFTLHLLLIPAAHAGEDADKCEEEGKKAAKECADEGKSAEATNKALADAAKASLPNPTVYPGSTAAKDVDTKSKGNLDDAKNKCEEKKKGCEDKCDKDKKNAGQKRDKLKAQNQGKCEGKCKEHDKDNKEDVDKKKESACMLPIMGMMGQLGDGSGDAGNAAQQAGNTGNQSAAPPIPPIPPPKPEDKPTPADPTKPSPMDPLACGNDPNAATLTKCTETLVKKCTPALNTSTSTDPSCDTFVQRYCNAAPPNAGTGPNMTIPAPGINHPGDGVGTQFCNLAIAHNFCQDPARDKCLTCQNYRAITSPACQQNPTLCNQNNSPQQTAANNCPVPEPIGTTPKPSPTPSPTPPTGDTGDRYTSTGTAKPATKNGVNGAGKSYGGEGLGLPSVPATGGGGDLNDQESALAKKHGIGIASVGGPLGLGRAPASHNEVAGQSGPNLFNISSGTYRQMCAANRLQHCGTR